MTREELLAKRIGVLMGGVSAEREVSLSSGAAVLDALKSLGYDAVGVDLKEDAARRIWESRIEVAFVALHGRWGEDGVIQGLLEAMGIPYTGSGVLASALGMDKVRSRWIFERHGLPVPPYKVLTPKEARSFVPGLQGPDLPLVVKPSREGSSIGVHIVREKGDLRVALEEALSFGHQVLVERYIPGREIQVGILDDRALGAIEIRPKLEFYDYSAKYTDGLAEHIFPAPLEAERYQRALDLALEAHRLLGCEGGTRVDMRLEEPGDFHVLEVNTLPGMTPLSLLPEIAAGVGIGFAELCERILFGARLKA
ncbi:MAG: D-alanine--D-alanine ligase [Thermodesulfobacteriota bacterium]